MDYATELGVHSAVASAVSAALYLPLLVLYLVKFWKAATLASGYLLLLCLCAYYRLSPCVSCHVLIGFSPDLCVCHSHSSRSIYRCRVQQDTLY